MMNYNKLGKTNLNVSEIGFGCWGIGGNPKNSLSYGKTDDKESMSALSLAFELGVNFFDTSPLYGFGHSEILIGSTFKKKRNNIIIATKVGYKDFKGSSDFSKRFINNSVNKSLKRLQTDYIDLLQLHDVPIKEVQNNSHILNTLKILQKNGKIRYYGISFKSPCEKINFDNISMQSIQANLNILDQRAIESELIKNCLKNNVGFIARTPLGFGFLTGAYLNKVFENGDHRNRFSNKQLEIWSTSFNLFNKDYNISNAKFAINFCLSYDGVTTTIPGMISMDHVRENIDSVNLKKFSKTELNNFLKIYKKNNFFVK